ncbi:Putative plastid-lipid-associated protein 4, chloroplastic [Glycine soja]|nr:Putative plastid-lipid-associated protein 4, chloroplastic [Glycine soja]
MVSFFPGFLTKGSDVQKLKVELYEAIAPLDRGAEATPEDQQRVDQWAISIQIARKLEAVNPVKEPLKSGLLNGKWELFYTTSQSILQTQRPKLLRPNGKIYQAINVDTLRAQNIETWPFYNQATANLVPLNSKRVAVKFDFFKIASLIPIKSPGSGRGQLEITYLDEDLRSGMGPCICSSHAQRLPYAANLNPNSSILRRRAQFISFASNSSPPQDEEATAKKSFAVATGELFLGLATRLIKSRNKGSSSLAEDSGSVGMFENNSEERIGAVVEDKIDPNVVWEQGVKGAAQSETTPLAGSSAGAIVCAVIASGASMEEALNATKILAEDCRNRGTAFRLGFENNSTLVLHCKAVLRDILDKFLPDDVHIRSNGRVRVAVTQLLWRPRGLLVDQFDSKEDLINAVFTSSFIPGYLAPRPATMFRNRLCIDGGLTLFMPPTSAAQTVKLRNHSGLQGKDDTRMVTSCEVRVCAFPASRLGLQGIGISPDCNPENVCSPRQLFNWALEPAEDAILDRFFELGYLDASVWAKENPVEVIVQDDSPAFGSSSAT